jgi:hypothetical protein
LERANMPVTQNSPAPYAPASVIIGLIARHRAKGLPAPITIETLQRASVSDSLAPRTLQALQILDLIDDAGGPTDTFEQLRLSPEDGFKTALSEWLKGTYADAFAYIDPETATETQVRDVFRHYKPVGQQDRMVSLFLGLCEAAGLAPERKRKTPQRPTGQRGSLQSKMRSLLNPEQPQKVRVPVQAPDPTPTRTTRGHVSALPPALSGLLASLPPSGETWGKTERDRFVATFQAVLDFCYPVSTGPRRKIGLSDEEDDE